MRPKSDGSGRVAKSFTWKHLVDVLGNYSSKLCVRRINPVGLSHPLQCAGLSGALRRQMLPVALIAMWRSVLELFGAPPSPDDRRGRTSVAWREPRAAPTIGANI